jgi:hypothetical protein
MVMGLSIIKMHIATFSRGGKCLQIPLVFGVCCLNMPPTHLKE